MGLVAHKTLGDRNEREDGVGCVWEGGLGVFQQAGRIQWRG